MEEEKEKEIRPEEEKVEENKPEEEKVEENKPEEEKVEEDKPEEVKVEENKPEEEKVEEKKPEEKKEEEKIEEKKEEEKPEGEKEEERKSEEKEDKKSEGEKEVELEAEGEEEQENPDNADDVTFISRFFLMPGELYKKEKYMLSIMRISIFERILNTYLFQSTSKELSLYPFLDTIPKDQKKFKIFNTTLKYISENFIDDFPLVYFSELVKEINRLLKIGNLKELKFDKYILKLEFLLAWHFENNFMIKQIDNRLGMNYYDNAQIVKGRTNYVYSIECLNTIFKFMNIFEKQSLSTRIDNEFPLIHNLFCCEKIYFFYCDKLNREKIPSGNIVKYLLEQITARIESSKNAKTNNYDSDNYYMMNLYLINHIIQFYPFYFHKKPELMEIFSGLKILKNFPHPVGNLCSEVMDNTLNEILFQGISCLNRLRQAYFLDILDKKVNTIDVKYFRYTLLVYSNVWEERHKNKINTEHPDGFNLIKFIDRLRTKPKSFHKQKLVLREIVLKLLITIIINSKQIYSDETFKKLYQAFMPNYKELYEEEGLKEKSAKEKQAEEELNEEEEEKEENDEDKKDEEEEKPKKNKININNKDFKQKPSRIKSSLDKLLKIVDVGLDKSIDDFDKEINLIANKLISMGGDPLNIQNDENIDSILDNKGYLPVNSLRNYLKPYYTDKKRIYKITDEKKTNALDIFDTYTKIFKYVVKNYFSYFLTENIEDNLIDNNLQTLRINFYNNFRINILIFEEENTINELLDNIHKMLKHEEINKKITDESFNSFWKFFVEKKTDIQPKFLLHVVPHYETDAKNPFRVLSSEDSIDDNCTYLSEFIASNDYIYKTIIFMPFSSNCDAAFWEYIPNCQPHNKNVLQFPSLDIMYSFIKKPLDYYIGDSNGILNLDIYKISVNGQQSKLFYKNIQFLIDGHAGGDFHFKITLHCVDYLGIEAKEEKVIELHNSFVINIFNLFFKKNVPFNYNMNSNNGWMEMFLDDKYDKNTYDSYCLYNNFINTNNENKYYEEFNMPETNIETRFKNYKVKKFVLETNNANICIKYDDSNVYDYTKIETAGGGKKSDFRIRFTIEPYTVNENKYCLPVATFTTI